MLPQCVKLWTKLSQTERKDINADFFTYRITDKRREILENLRREQKVLCTGKPKPGKTPGKKHLWDNGNNYLEKTKTKKKKKQTEDNSTDETVYENCKNVYQAVKM